MHVLGVWEHSYGVDMDCSGRVLHHSLAPLLQRLNYVLIFASSEGADCSKEDGKYVTNDNKDLTR